MLSEIRNNVNHPFIKGLLGIIIIVFVLFFGWSMRGANNMGGGSQSSGATVNGEPISAEEYRQAYSNLVELYSRVTGQALTADQVKQFGVDKRALDQVVDQKLLLQEAKRLKLEVSDEELALAISRQATFMENGVFSKDKYSQLLSNAGLSAARYEEMKRQELLLGKVQDSFKASVTVSEEDIVKEFKDKSATVAVEYAAFDPEKFSRQVLVTTEKLKEFYTAEGEKFKVEEKRRAKFAHFPVESYMGQVVVSEEDARKEFARSSFRFAKPAMVHARHLLLRTDKGADPAKVEKRIKELRDMIVKGQDFATLAKNYSEDEGSKPTGGDLGFFPRNSMVPEFERAAFALKVGEVSQPVQTQFGYHLIKVEAKSEERQPAFEEVKGEVVNFIKREKAEDIAYKDADNTLMDLEQKRIDWDGLAKKHRVATTGLITAKERDPSAPAVKGFNEALFDIPEGKVGQVLDSQGGSYIITLVERTPAQVPPFETIRAQVEAKFRVVESRKLAKEAAAKFAAEAASKGWASLAKSLGVETATSETFSMKGQNIPGLGPAPDAVKAIFEKPELGRVVPTPFELNDKQYVFRISAYSSPNMGGLELEREKLKADVLARKQEQAAEDRRKALRDAAKLEGVENFLGK